VTCQNTILEKYELKTANDDFGSYSRPRSFAIAKIMPACAPMAFSKTVFLTF